MNIYGILLNPEMRTGGHRRYVELMDGLQQAGHTVTLICSPAARELVQHCRPVVLEINARDARFFGIRSLALLFRSLVTRWVQELPEPPVCDWVMIHGESHFPAGRIVAEASGARLHFAFRSNLVEEQRVLRRWGKPSLSARLYSYAVGVRTRIYEQKIGRHADVLSFQSTVDLEEIISRIPAARAKADIIPGNIGPPRFPAQLEQANRSERMRTIIYVGGLGWRKGVDYLLEALALAMSHVPDLRLRIVGFGPEQPDHEALARRLGVDHAVEFLGRIHQPLELIAAADLSVVPSLFDSFPDTVLESLHVGTPVVGTRAGGVPEEIGDSRYLVDPADPPALAELFVRLAQDTGFYQEARAHTARQAARFHFDWVEAWVTSMQQADRRIAADGAPR